MEVGDTIIVRIHRKAQVLVELFAQFKVFRWNKGFDFGDTQVGQVNPIWRFDLYFAPQSMARSLLVKKVQVPISSNNDVKTHFWNTSDTVVKAK